MRRPYRYLIDPIEARQALADFAAEGIIGLDTETYWDSVTGGNCLSLLQLAKPYGEVVIIDALSAAITEARMLIESAEILKVAHNARFDEGSLKSAGFVPAGLVDSLRLARRAIPLKSFSLASIAYHLFGMEMDKTWQRSDWRSRPLSRDQLEYAALDAQMALAIYDGLAEKLIALGRWEKEKERARLDFKTKKEPRPPKRKNAQASRPPTASERKQEEQERTGKSSEHPGSSPVSPVEPDA